MTKNEHSSLSSRQSIVIVHLQSRSDSVHTVTRLVPGYIFSFYAIPFGHLKNSRSTCLTKHHYNKPFSVSIIERDTNFPEMGV